MNRNKKAALTTLLLAAAAVSFFPLAARTGYYDSGREQGFQKTLGQKAKQVMGVWLAARAVSGVMSFLESVEITGQTGAFGSALGGSVRPLAWIEPAKNVLDRLSTICLWAGGALMIEKFLLAISAWAVFKIVAPLCLVILALSLWAEKRLRIAVRYAVCLCVAGIAVCAAVPLSLRLSHAAEKRIFSAEIEKTTASIGEKNGTAQSMLEDVEQRGLSIRVIDSVRNFLSRAKTLADSMVQDMTNYVMMFVVTNIILPILTIAGLGYLAKYLCSLILAGSGAGSGQTKP